MNQLTKAKQELVLELLKKQPTVWVVMPTQAIHTSLALAKADSKAVGGEVVAISQPAKKPKKDE